MSQDNVEIVREVMGLLRSAAKGERIDELLERFDRAMAARAEWPSAEFSA